MEDDVIVDREITLGGRRSDINEPGSDDGGTRSDRDTWKLRRDLPWGAYVAVLAHRTTAEYLSWGRPRCPMTRCP